MTHFGVICPPFSGHLNPLSALGRELQSRGHRVTFLQIADREDYLRSEGMDFWAIGQSAYEPGEFAESLKQIGQLSGVKSLCYSVTLCQKLTDVICQDVPDAIAAAGIEALLVDQLEPAGATVAEYLGLPAIVISCAQAIRLQPDIPPFFTSWNYQPTWWANLRNRIAYLLLDRYSQGIQTVLNQHRRQWNLPLKQGYSLSNSQLAHISQQPAAFDFPYPNRPPFFHYTGPLRNASPRSMPFPFERLTGQPLIYASLGTMQHTKQAIFHCVAAACESLDVQLVLAHGGAISDTAAQRLPGSPLVVDYAPQLEVIAKASLTITHGGMNTVLDSLSHGVPLIAIPMTYEQPGNGARIQWTGTGEVIALNRLSVSRLQATIQRVLVEKTYAISALKYQQAIAQAGGVTRAAGIVEQAVGHIPQRQADYAQR